MCCVRRGDVLLTAVVVHHLSWCGGANWRGTRAYGHGACSATHNRLHKRCMCNCTHRGLVCCTCPSRCICAACIVVSTAGWPPTCGLPPAKLRGPRYSNVTWYSNHYYPQPLCAQCVALMTPGVISVCVSMCVCVCVVVSMGSFVSPLCVHALYSGCGAGVLCACVCGRGRRVEWCVSVCVFVCWQITHDLSAGLSPVSEHRGVQRQWIDGRGLWLLISCNCCGSRLSLV